MRRRRERRPGNTLDQAVDQLYDPIIALQRQALDIERNYRDLAHRDDLAVDTLGAPHHTPAEGRRDCRENDHAGSACRNRGSGNSRLGSRSKMVLTDACGQVEIDVPRDRAGTFESQIA